MGRVSPVRILFAVIFIFVGLQIGIRALSWFPAFRAAPPMLVLLATIAYFAALLGASRSLFGFPPLPWKLRKTNEELLTELRRDGLLTEEQHRAERAFAVEEFEDEGSQYFIELDDGRVLFLCGQYLYEDEPEGEEPRRFPCTEFTILRHKKHGYVVDLVCTGDVFEPEGTAPHLTPERWGSDEWPDDGDIIEGVTYDQVRRQMLQ